MKEDKKEQRRREQLAALFGMEEPAKLTGPTKKHRSQDASREAEAVINYHRHPNQWLEYGIQICDNPKCKQRFMTNRGNVGSCSDACRAAICEEIGLTWDWSKPPESRWSVKSCEISADGKKMVETSGNLTREPLVITGAALQVVEQLDSLKQHRVEDEAIVSEVNVNVEVVDDLDAFFANLDS